MLIQMKLEMAHGDVLANLLPTQWEKKREGGQAFSEVAGRLASLLHWVKLRSWS